jgi:hypothetical protein
LCGLAVIEQQSGFGELWLFLLWLVRNQFIDNRVGFCLLSRVIVDGSHSQAGTAPVRPVLIVLERRQRLERPVPLCPRCESAVSPPKDQSTGRTTRNEK